MNMDGDGGAGSDGFWVTPLLGFLDPGSVGTLHAMERLFFFLSFH